MAMKEYKNKIKRKITIVILIMLIFSFISSDSYAQFGSIWTGLAPLSFKIISDKKNEEIWRRIRSRFKTSEVELERKKWGLETRDDYEVAFEQLAGLLDTGETELSGEVGLDKARSKKLHVPGETGEVKFKKKAPDTIEVKIETGENLFLMHCYTCHFGSGRINISNPLAGKNFWIKYNDNDAGLKKNIRSGYKGDYGDMPSYSEQRLSEKEADAILDHLKSMLQPIKIKKDIK